MNCSELARVLDLADLDARFDRRAATTHLARCSGCRDRFPEIAALLRESRADRRTRPRIRLPARFAVATSLLIGVAIALVARLPNDDPSRPVAAEEPRASGVRYLPASASTVQYTTRRLVAAGDPRTFESVVVRGGARDDRAATNGRLR